MTTKICITCHLELQSEDFYPVSSKFLYLRGECKKCKNLDQKKKYSPERRKNNHLKRLYGITLDEYKQMFENQNGQCLICKTTNPTGKNKSFHVDHDHESNKIRGLLCHSCNLMIGQAKDNVQTLQSAIEYLQHWNNS